MLSLRLCRNCSASRDLKSFQCCRARPNFPQEPQQNLPARCYQSLPQAGLRCLELRWLMQPCQRLAPQLFPVVRLWSDYQRLEAKVELEEFVRVIQHLLNLTSARTSKVRRTINRTTRTILSISCTLQIVSLLIFCARDLPDKPPDAWAHNFGSGRGRGMPFLPFGSDKFAICV